MGAGTQPSHFASSNELCSPESLGIVTGVVFLMFIIGAQMVYYRTPEQLLTYNSSLLAICFMVFLGFADDVLDLPWRYKLFLPVIASLPMLCAYSGVTWVKLPRLVGPLLASPAGAGAAAGSDSQSDFTLLGAVVNAVVEVDLGSAGTIVRLGVLYHVYMGLLSVFCTNAINIYSGINGLEAGQALVMGFSVLFVNLFELRLAHGTLDHPHVFSIRLIVPFLGATAALLRHNWYPSAVFVGDTFCYFAGMTFAVVGIQGHFSKTLLLFFIPQIFNFLYSTPQLFKLRPCPRHRLPKFDAAIGKLRPSQYAHNGALHDNLTLVNLVLRLLGPLSERTLVLVLLALQVVTCALGLWLRYEGAALLYGKL